MSAPMAKVEAIAARDVGTLTAILRDELRAGRDSIPAELKALKGWLVWRVTEIDATTGKMNKIPSYPCTGQRRRGEQGGAADLANLGTWDDAAAALEKDRTLAGVGFAMLQQFGLVALDVDHCVENGKIRDDAASLADRTYCEISPSDTGIRAFWLGSASNGQNKENGFELYSTKQFVTVTGNRVSNAQAMLGGALPALDATTRATLEALSRPAGAAGKADGRAPGDDLGRMAAHHAVTAETIDDLRAALAAIPATGGYTGWFEKVHALAFLKETEFEADALQLADEWSQRFGADYDADELARKWDGPPPASLTHKSIFEWAQAAGWKNPRKGAPPQLATAESVAVVAATTNRRFPRQSMAEITSRPAPAWRVKGLLPSTGVAMIYGASTSGKSFFALDLGMDIAKGEAWRGQTTKQGPVVYVCAEGADDFAKRVTAYAKHYNTGLLPFEVIDAAPNLMVKADVEALIVELMRAPVGVVFLDTLACMSAGGDENTAKDMTVLVDNCKLIGQMTGALITLLHHTGKDESKGARGSSSLYGAMDTVIEISRAGDVRTAKVTKQKGGPDGQEFGFKLIPVVVGEDEDGDEVSSCVLEHTAAVPKAERQKELKGKYQRPVMRALQRAVDLTGEGMFAADLIAAAANEIVQDPAVKRDTRRQRCTEAIEELLAANRIVKENGLIIPA